MKKHELDNFEIVSVFYNTPHFLKDFLKSIRKHIGDNLVHIVDGSDEKHFEKINEPNVIQYKLGYNIHHGGGMDFGIKKTKSKFVLILDSDVKITGDLKQKLYEILSKNDIFYCIGKIMTLSTNLITPTNFRYGHPELMFLNKDMYEKYPPFINHGWPCVLPMQSIQTKKEEHLLVQIKDIGKIYDRGGRGTVNATNGYHLKKEGNEKVNLQIFNENKNKYHYKNI